MNLSTDQIIISFPFLNEEKGNNVTVVNDNVYIDGYEYIDGEWKRTFKGLWYRWF